MANALKITIGTEEQTSAGAPINPNMGSNAANTTKMVARSVYATQILNAAKQTIKSEFDYQVGRIGDTTGDYLKQAEINAKLDALGTLGNLTLNVGMGYAAMGPIGGTINAVIQLGNVGLQTYRNAQTFNLNLAKQNAGAAFSGQAIGDILTNGNRG